MNIYKTDQIPERIEIMIKFKIQKYIDVIHFCQMVLRNHAYSAVREEKRTTNSDQEQNSLQYEDLLT